MREPRDRLSDRDHLARLGERRRDDAVGVGFQFGVAELVACELERALGALDAAFGFVLRQLLAVEVRDRREAALAQCHVALMIGGGLRLVGGRGGKLGGRAFGLQLRVLRVEPRHDIAGVHAVADIDDARDDLAGDAEAEIGFMPRPHHADEFARGVFAFEGDALHLHRALALDRGRGRGLAAGEQQHHGEGSEAMGRQHRTLRDHRIVTTDELPNSSAFRRSKSHRGWHMVDYPRGVMARSRKRAVSRASASPSPSCRHSATSSGWQK